MLKGVQEKGQILALLSRHSTACMRMVGSLHRRGQPSTASGRPGQAERTNAAGTCERLAIHPDGREHVSIRDQGARHPRPCVCPEIIATVRSPRGSAPHPRTCGGQEHPSARTPFRTGGPAARIAFPALPDSSRLRRGFGGISRGCPLSDHEEAASALHVQRQSCRGAFRRRHHEVHRPQRHVVPVRRVLEREGGTVAIAGPGRILDRLVRALEDCRLPEVIRQFGQAGNRRRDGCCSSAVANPMVQPRDRRAAVMLVYNASRVRACLNEKRPGAPGSSPATPAVRASSIASSSASSLRSTSASMSDSLNSRPITAAIVSSRRVVGLSLFQTLSDQLADAFREPDFRKRDNAVPLVAPGERVRLVEMLQHLDDEERVTFRVPGHECGQRRWRVAAGPRLDHPADIVVGEAMQGKTSWCVFPAQ